MAATGETWEPIRRIDAPAVNVTKAGRRTVSVKLDRTPPNEWLQGFLHPSSVTTSTRMEADPRLFGDSVTFDCVDEAFDAYMKNVDERITGGNQRYEQQVLPQLERTAQERKSAEDARDAAQAKADEDAKKWDAGSEPFEPSSPDW